MQPILRLYPLCLAILISLLGSAPAATARAQAAVSVILDGRSLQLDPPPTIVDGRTLVPLRGVFKALGATVTWHPDDASITVAREGTSVRLLAERRLACVAAAAVETGCGQPVLLDVPAAIQNGRTFVPLRFVATALGARVIWDETQNAVLVDSQATPSAPVSAVTLAAPAAGFRTTAPITVQARVDHPEAALVRFFLLDPVSGRGPLLAVTTAQEPSFVWRPDPVQNGLRVLATAAYDAAGRYLDGQAAAVTVAVTPQVRLTGVEAGQTIHEPVKLSLAHSFVAARVRYAARDPVTGSEELIAEADPEAEATWSPQVPDNGPRLLVATAYDTSGTAYPAEAVAVEVGVKHQVQLLGSAAEDVVDGPVNLRIRANYPISRWAFLLIDPASGAEWVLAEGRAAPKPYRWFPGPERNGRWLVAAAAWDASGAVKRSDPVPLEVATRPRFLIRGVGPGAVLHGTVTLSGEANVQATHVEYRLRDPLTGQSTVLAGGGDVSAEYRWTPAATAGGAKELLAALTTAEAGLIYTDPIPIRVHMGPVYGKRPILPRELFVEFIRSLASRSYWETGMAASLQVAQAILETGWGGSSPVDRYTGQASHNMFGIKGTGPAGSVTAATWEVLGGVTYQVDDRFRAYSDPAESWRDHKAFLLERPRYAPFRSVMADPVRGAWALLRSGYATDPQYAIKLIGIMQREGLFALDLVEP